MTERSRTELSFGIHAHAVEVSGYTILPQQVRGAELDSLRACSDEALRAAENAVRAGRKLKYTGSTDYYRAARCMYCWGPPCVRLLENDAVHGLSALLLGSYHLWDLTVLTALPTPQAAEKATTSWHRDFDGPHRSRGGSPGYLWFFLCLDEMTPENGATWVVPGSHRLSSKYEPAVGDAWTGDSLENYPSRIQLCGKAGDIVVIDPSMLHTSGRNHSLQPRRILSINVCHRDLPPLLDHWAIAGPRVQETAGDRLRTMLGANRAKLDATWQVLPENWETV